ncbi:acetyltransferase [Paraglaciecola polaris]|uniref:acetyltransferase n=1 Tax=Paraglaciecola polaris TaxID=222814 RepID=UPI0030EEB8C4|tara:strand:- start:286 stop:945 length:660 start_codon:yes stop_codon:yes gene_type:complete
MNRVLIGIYGASGFGKEVYPLVRGSIEQDPNVDLCFIDDGSKLSQLLGLRVLTYTEFKNAKADTKKCVIAIADSKVRRFLAEQLKSDGIDQFSVRAKNIVILDNVNIGDGSILCPFVTLTSDIIVGKAFHANIYSYVAHDCVIGDFVTFAPSVKCNGNVIIHDNAYIGTGAIIKQGTPDKPRIIGEGAVVGMGAVVTKNVEPGDVVVGNPAKSLKRLNR